MCRMMTSSIGKKIPQVVYNMFFSKLVIPQADEGFHSVLKVNWQPSFDSEEMKASFLQYYELN